MGLRYWVEDGCAVVVFEGEYEARAGIDAIAAALRAGEAPLAGLLLDLSDSVSFRARSTEGLRAVASFLGTQRDRFGRRLALVGDTDLTYGLLRMGMVFTSDQGIESDVFRSREEGLEWLGKA